ncbi:ABC transporter substrate-binding protein [Actinokineospora sp. 24-640]
MVSLTRLRRALGAAAVGLLVSGTLAACGGDSSDKTQITVGLFGNFGYADLFAEYEQAHPEIDIVDRTASYSDHHKNLAAHLATGSGAADVEAVDVGYINQFKETPERFVDLNSKGGNRLQDRWLDWKWSGSLGRDGQQIGYGTDVGGLAICYRRDLLEAAGLPADRAEVAKLWPTWDAYIAAGKRFQAKAPDGVRWMDGGPSMLNAIVGQATVGYYDTTNKIVLGDNPEMRKAWELTMSAVDSGLSAGLLYSTPPWNTGFKQGQFATVTCPAWQMTKIKDQAPETSGKWDVAPVPGGGGNWGGSYLTVPAQGENIDAAVALADWLTAPEQQAKVFVTAGNLPSAPSLYGEQSIAGHTDPFFNDAPVGSLFTQAARALKPQYQGPRAGDIQTALGQAVQRVEQGNQAPDESWAQVVNDVSRLEK